MGSGGVRGELTQGPGCRLWVLEALARYLLAPSTLPGWPTALLGEAQNKQENQWWKEKSLYFLKLFSVFSFLPFISLSCLNSERLVFDGNTEIHLFCKWVLVTGSMGFRVSPTPKIYPSLKTNTVWGPVLLRGPEPWGVSPIPPCVTAVGCLALEQSGGAKHTQHWSGAALGKWAWWS